MPDFRLEVFSAVARRLSFTKAAAELFITQPAVTKHIHELEEQYKAKLFERNGNKIQLTEAGRVLLGFAEELFSVYRNIDFEMNALQHRLGGALHLGASTTVAQYVIPAVLAGFHARYSDVKLSLVSGNTGQVEQALLNKEIELGLVEGRSKNPSIRYTEFIKDEIVLVSNSLHAKPGGEQIGLLELKEIPLLLREPGSGTLEVIEHALKQHRLGLSDLRVDMHLGSTESIKSYLMHSPCMAFLSIHSVLPELRSGAFTVTDIKGMQIERSFYFIHLQGKPEGLAERFMRYARLYNFK
ncbi:MAG: LysR family transcriptional regulator [Williamsia sp.]|nr:LysR family transcriptional regulator [Williamsia sp.]